MNHRMLVLADVGVAVSRSLGVLLGLALACATSAAQEAPSFRKLLADEWEYTLREAPTFASHLGDKRYNVDSAYTAAVKRRLAATKNLDKLR